MTRTSTTPGGPLEQLRAAIVGARIQAVELMPAPMQAALGWDGGILVVLDNGRALIPMQTGDPKQGPGWLVVGERIAAGEPELPELPGPEQQLLEIGQVKPAEWARFRAAFPTLAALLARAAARARAKNPVDASGDPGAECPRTTDAAPDADGRDAR